MAREKERQTNNGQRGFRCIDHLPALLWEQFLLLYHGVEALEKSYVTSGKKTQRVNVPFQGSVDILITFCFLWSYI